MSSGASVSALQRLVEQLKLEAGVERIKVSVRPAGPQRQPHGRPSGPQETAARREWELPGRARTGASGAREPRVDAGWFQAESQVLLATQPVPGTRSDGSVGVSTTGWRHAGDLDSAHPAAGG